MDWFYFGHGGQGCSRGQGLIEYALIIALVAFIVIGTLVLLGPQVAADFPRTQTGL